MGAGQSSSEMPKQKTLSSTIDYIAANYILSSNFQDLKNLTNQEYCKNLVILTSDVINQYLTTTEIEFLKQRLDGNVETNTMTKTTVAYFNKNKIDKMDVKSDLKKKRMCVGIAKYYIQIFHIFNAIAHTINPKYTWKDQFGSMVTVDYEHRKDIPSDTKPIISKSNVCSNRLNALMKDNAILNALEFNNNKTIDVSTKFCNMNVNKDGTSKTMLNEPGIPEMEMLYYDVYDYNTGKFTSMSPTMSEQYKKDLQTFYTIFTGNKEMPSTITSFTQIPLREFQKTKSCEDGRFSKTYQGTLNEQLYLDYAKNLKTMVSNTEKNQNVLLSIIDQLFVYTIDPQDPTNKMIVINPKLDNNLLNKLVMETRTNILALYTTCELDFFRGLQIFEAIVEKRVKDTSVAQIKNLEQSIEDTISLDPTKTSLNPTKTSYQPL
jgi:hypothetical protein